MLEVALLDLAGGDELVDVLEALVVAHVADHGAVVGDVDLAGLVLEAAQGGVLDRGGLRVGRVDFDDPVEAVRLVRLLGDVETVVVLLPAAVGQLVLDGVAGVLAHQVLVVDLVDAAEVLVDVLLAGEHGAPRGDAAGAVVEGADDLLAGRVLVGLEQVVAGGGAGDGELGEAGDAAVELVALDRLEEALVVLLDRQHGMTVGGDADVDLLLGGLLDVPVAEHHRLGGVLVRADVDEGAIGGLEDAGEVIVEAELLHLGLGGLLVEVPLGGAVLDRVAPGDEHVLLVALGDDDLVLLVGLDDREAHALGGLAAGAIVTVAAAGAGRTAVAIVGGAGGQQGRAAEGDGRGTAGLEGLAAAVGALGDVREVLVGRELVGGVVTTGVAALVRAGQGTTGRRERILQQVLAGQRHCAPHSFLGWIHGVGPAAKGGTAGPGHREH